MLFRPLNLAISKDRSQSLIDDDEIINYLTSDDYTGADSALKNSDLYSVINQVSGDIAACRFTTKKNAVQKLLDSPASTTNKRSFWQYISAQLLLDGNAYAYIWRNLNGLPLRLEALRPSQVATYLLDDGSGLIYNLNFDEPNINTMQNVPQSNILHFRLLSKTGGMLGISPLTALKDELSIKKSSNNLTLNALSKAIMPNGLLKIKGMGLLDPETRAAQSRGFLRQLNSSRGPVVLDDLSDYEPLEIKSDVSKLLASTDWTSKQIAKVYGIPDSYLNGQGDQQSSLEMIEGMYANALNRYVQAIQSEIEDKLKTTVNVDISPAIDQDGSSYAKIVGTLTGRGAITGQQATFLLKNNGFLPDDVPDFDINMATRKGGDNSGN